MPVAGPAAGAPSWQIGGRGGAPTVDDRRRDEASGRFGRRRTGSGIIRAVTVRRPIRRFAALVALLATVVAQSAAAAYACASRADAIAAAPSAVSPCAEHLAMGTDPGAKSPNLCEVHCQSALTPALVHPVMAPAPESAIEVPPPAAVRDGQDALPPEAKVTPPPARSLYCRLQL